MNTNLAVVNTTKKGFNVPTITDTTPYKPEKEIDLSFWKMIERDRKAKAYSESVSAQRETKRVFRTKEIISSIFAGFCMVLFTCGFFWVGLFM